MIYFPTDWGAKEPQNLPNHRVDEERSFFGEHFLRKKLEKATVRDATPMKHCYIASNVFVGILFP